jgi:hypothetical protein
MMILKLMPGVVTNLPLTSYYSITLINLYVGDSGITSCVLKIGDQQIEFKNGDYSPKEVLTVNGDPANTFTHILLPGTGNGVSVQLSEKFNTYTDNCELLLFYQLEYFVPTERPIFNNILNVETLREN